MLYRIHELLSSESIATAATKTIAVDLSDVISAIAIRVKGTNNGSTPTAHPATIVTKVELVDGSDTLVSLSGKEIQALNFYENHELPFNICEYENNIECCAVMWINFGRYLMDEKLALDPKKFNNLQLKIQHNKALGGSAPDAGTMQVSAYLFDDRQPAPMGFLSSKEVKSYTITASGHEYTDLDKDMPYGRLLVGSLSASNPPSGQMSKVKLTEDGGKKTPFNDISVSELCKILAMGKRVKEDFAGLGTGSAVTYYIASTYEQYGTGIGRSASQTTLIVGQPSGNAIAVTNDSSESFACHVEGYCPHGFVELPISRPEDLTTYFDPTGLKNLRLDITAASGGSGTVEIVSQQLRKY